MPVLSHARNCAASGCRFVDALVYNETRFIVGAQESTIDYQVLKKLGKYTNVEAFPGSQEQQSPSGQPVHHAFALVYEWFHSHRQRRQTPVFFLEEPWGFDERLQVQILVESLARQHGLAGGFYSPLDIISRLFGQEVYLVPTIAYQLVQSFPGLGTYMKSAIDRDPIVFKRSFTEMFVQLIVEPLHELQNKDGAQAPTTKVFIINDSNACFRYADLQMKVEFITKILRECDIPLVFLVISRPPPPRTARLIGEPRLISLVALTFIRMDAWATSTVSGLARGLTCFTFSMGRHSFPSIRRRSTSFWNALSTGVLSLQRMSSCLPGRNHVAVWIVSVVLHYHHRRVSIMWP